MSGPVDVSVVVPTHDGEAYLDACLASIAAQDLSGVEVLVIDDGSRDASVEVARGFGTHLPELRVLTNPSRLGAVANVNRCVEEARGRWIKPVFQDDLLEPGALARLRAARSRHSPVVVGARTYRYEDGVPAWQRDACQHLEEQSLTRRFGSGHLPGSRVADVTMEMAASHRPQLNFVGEPVAVLVRRDAARRAGGFDPGYVQLWDYELILRLTVGPGIILVDEPTATFRVHQGSETARNLAGTAFASEVGDRLRLHAAYATGRAYAPVRRAATRADPPVDLTALANGVATAATRLVEELPDASRDEARARVDEATTDLARPAAQPASSDTTESEATTALLAEHSTTGAGDQPAPAPLDATPTDAIPPQPGDRPTGGRGLDVRVRAALRTSQWWGHMVGPILAMAYLQIGWRSAEASEAYARVAALVVSAAALAGYAYVVNDSFDVDGDRRAGKPNAMAPRPWPVRLAWAVGLGAAGAVPWLLVPLGPWGAVLLAAIYLMPWCYSAPPLRLKEREIGGPLADAANAFVLPALFTIALFTPLGVAAGPPALMVAGALAWTVGRGLRAILIHQISDAGNDRAAGTWTFVGRIGPGAAQRAMRRWLFPLELAGLAALVATVATWSWGLVAVGLGWVVLFNGARLTGVIERGLATTTVAEGWFLHWCQLWPALALSVALAAGDPAFVGLIALTVVLFWDRVREGCTIFGREARRELRRGRRRRSGA